MSRSLPQMLAICLLLIVASAAVGPPRAASEPGPALPVIVVDPLFIDLTLPAGGAAQRWLGIANAGEPGSVLEYSIEIDDPYIPDRGAGPRDRSIEGSTLTPDPDAYGPGEIMLIGFTVFNDSDDYEWLDEVTISFPMGVTVLGSTDFVGGTGGPLVSDHSLGEGITLTWFDANGGYGNVWHQESAIALVLLYFNGGDMGDIGLPFTISGEVYGDPPHDIAGKMVLRGPGTGIILLEEPNGGEQWPVGEEREILWAWKGEIPAVNLSLSRDFGESWEAIAGPIENTGAFTWLVEGPLSAGCLVEVSADSGDAGDRSDAPFSIHVPVTWIELPVTEGELEAGERDELLLDFDGEGMVPGEYEANLVVSSNAGEDVIVPLRLVISETTASAPAPEAFALEPNYPNPFNPTTTIGFSLSAAGPAELAIYDVGGRRLRLLAMGSLAAGRHSVVWDGRDGAGRSLPSGIYLYRLSSGEGRITRKMLLVK